MKPLIIFAALAAVIVSTLSAQRFESDIIIQEPSPTILFKDTTSGHDDYWIHANNDKLYFLWDEGDDGDWDSPYPLYLERRDSIFGGNMVLRRKGNDAGDLVFQKEDRGQLGRIWTSNSGLSGLCLSSGDYSSDIYIDNDGKVGIGTTSPDHKLDVNGTIRAKEVIVESGWSDYVFEKDYKLAPLSEVEAHIEEKGHLPGIPSAADIEANGAKLSELVTLQMAKIEELTLHLIEKEKEISSIRANHTRELSSILQRLEALEQ